MSKVVRLTLLFLLIALTCSCAKKTLVALAPDPEGKVGAISVSNEAGSVAIDTPYQATTVGTKGPKTPENLGKEKVERIFAEALSIQPKRPLHFLLYFEKDVQLTSESEKLLSDVVAAIRERNSQDISVIGHTDTVGSKEYNTDLSNRRAIAVKNLLVGQGVAAASLRTTSHGKENPLIPTADGVNEPRNRRVEVVVR